MKPYRIFLLVIFLAIVFFVLFGFYIAAFEAKTLFHKVFFPLGSIGGIWLGYYILQDYINHDDFKYDFFIDKFVFQKNDKSTEINRSEIESISFESRNNLNIIIKTKSGEKIPYMPSGFGLKAIRELETWWGQPIKGKKANLSYEHILRYAEMFDKIKKIFIRSND